MIRNIIFDWSGTLVNDLPAVWRSTNQVFERAGVPTLTLDEFRSEFALPFTGFYKKYLPQLPLPQLEKWFHGYLLSEKDSIAVLPHAREFLLFCREAGIGTYVLSTIREDYFHPQAAQFELGEYFIKPYLGVVDKREKIKAILAENQLEADATLFIGDMQHDIETAHHGGVHSCGVLTGYNRADQLRSSQPTLVVEHLGELQAILQRHELRLPLNEQAQYRDLDDRPIATVGALIFNSRREVLMIRTHKWSHLWGIPGGKIKGGESSLDALRREVREETQLEIDDIRFAWVQDCVNSPEFYRNAHFILLNYTCSAREPAQVVLNEEAQEYCWIPMSQVRRLKLNTPSLKLIEVVETMGDHST